MRQEVRYLKMLQNSKLRCKSGVFNSTMKYRKILKYKLKNKYQSNKVLQNRSWNVVLILRMVLHLKKVVKSFTKSKHYKSKWHSIL